MAHRKQKLYYTQVNTLNYMATDTTEDAIMEAVRFTNPEVGEMELNGSLMKEEASMRDVVLSH